MSNKLLIIISTVLTLFFLELFCVFILFQKDDYNYKNRYMLFTEGKVYKNLDSIFTYHPNKKIIASTYYFKDGNFNQVYRHEINTNNLGLVQKNDVKHKFPSILFLGDSFTEGQGAVSWIDKFDGNYKNFQIINGGFLGTGFQQFKLLDNYLSDFNIKKVFVLFIGDDLRRDVFQFNDQQLKCLNNHKLCQGFEDFYGFPLSNKDPLKFLKELKKKQTYLEKKDEINLKLIRRNIKSKISNLYIVKIPLDFLRSNFYQSNNEKILRNFKAIDNLYQNYRENIFFVHLKMKQEIKNKKKSYESIYVKKYITDLTKNYFECEFNNDLNNFYNYDAHPNKKGYQSLYNCILNILEKEKI